MVMIICINSLNAKVLNNAEAKFKKRVAIKKSVFRTLAKIYDGAVCEQLTVKTVYLFLYTAPL